MTSPLEIGQHLKRIISANVLVTVFSNHGKSFILTKLLAIDLKSGRFAFDAGSSDDANRQLLKSERNVFVCTPDGIKTQFVTGPVQSFIYDGAPAFLARLPPEVVKLQRREYFRIQTPIANRWCAGCMTTRTRTAVPASCCRFTTSVLAACPRPAG